ncbi:hypothetical protein Baya_5532 [Bagarius yarrelli]|uniref:Uncharacterized protein n=1 Tax=Bagarius yarrelli TaxID=175774 RepID=A0A556TV21_BAGYA|nr:hypothetical protein Baya_5532 [Bagarius yarrelli]
MSWLNGPDCRVKEKVIKRYRQSPIFGPYSVSQPSFNECSSKQEAMDRVHLIDSRSEVVHLKGNLFERARVEYGTLSEDSRGRCLDGWFARYSDKNQKQHPCQIYDLGMVRAPHHAATGERWRTTAGIQGQSALSKPSCSGNMHLGNRKRPRRLCGK